MRKARISTLPRIIRKINSHLSSMKRDGPTTPTLIPVVARAEVVSKIESIGRNP
jgi:hypothetical protein